MSKLGKQAKKNKLKLSNEYYNSKYSQHLSDYEMFDILLETEKQYFIDIKKIYCLSDKEIFQLIKDFYNLSISTPIKFTRCVEYFHAMCSNEIPIDKAKVFLDNYAKYGIDMYKCYIY